MDDTEEKNNTSGPEEPSAITIVLDAKTNKVVSLADFKAGKKDPLPAHWPAAIPQGETVGVTASATAPVPEKDPLERRILVSSTYGDIVIDGYLGLSQTFLAVGDNKGQIKFALAPGIWLAATDVTNDPKYAENNGWIEPETDDVA